MKKDSIGLHHGHDSTVVYIKDGEIVEAMSEERLSRIKKHAGFPHKSFAYLKDKYTLTTPKTLYFVGSDPIFDGSIFLDEAWNKNWRKTKLGTRDYKRSLQFYFPWIQTPLDVYYSVKEKFILSSNAKKVVQHLATTFPDTTIERIHHHMAHAWATVPFMEDKTKEYLIFTLDGLGDNIAGSVNLFKDGSITKIQEVPAHASIGLLYNAIVNILGMWPGEHEFKVMGLAPYAKVSSGDEVYKKLKELVWFDKESMTITSSITTSKATSYFIANNFHRYRFDSLAYGVQKLLEDIVQEMVLTYIAKYKIHNIALGGGVFMNVKANQILLALPEVERLVIAPSCGDESLAIGAAVYGFVKQGNTVTDLKPVKNIYFGSEYSNSEIKKAIDGYMFTSKIQVEDYTKNSISVEQKVAEILAQNNVVGRFKGRAEWGARALGNRSILANPSSHDTIKLINEMIKGRDFWMPFATSLLHEDADLYLKNPKKFFAPYMSITFHTTEKAAKELSAALHPYDLTSRPQMVTKEMNKEYHALISEYKKLTGSSGILNTSFNLHGEPNVEKPEDALRTFDLSGLQYLAIGDYLISKIK